jgi:hypothetical protein
MITKNGYELKKGKETYAFKKIPCRFQTTTSQMLSTFLIAATVSLVL